MRLHLALIGLAGLPVLVACGGNHSATQSGDGGAGDQTVTLTMAPFTVPPGGEVYKCQNFANPFGGGDTEVQEFESHMAVGSHHVLLFYRAGATDGALEDCSGLEFAPTPYGSQVPDFSLSYPPGVAAMIPSTMGLRLQSHYLNATTQPILASVKVIFHRAPAGSVTAHAGLFFFGNPNLMIPSTNLPYSASKTCSIGANVNLLLATSHMHQHGTGVTALLDGSTTLYQTSDWNEPKPKVFAPPMPIAAGSSVTFTCTWINDTGAPLTFGESAATNEMCILTLPYYPAIHDAPTTSCL
jgi:hypothetical protein